MKEFLEMKANFDSESKEIHYKFVYPSFKFAIDPNVEIKCKIQNEKNEKQKLEQRFSISDFVPLKLNAYDSGWDVRSAETIELIPDSYIKIPLGFRVFSPPGWWLRIYPRSSTFTKCHLHALYGVVDNTYEGLCYFCAQFIPGKDDILTKNNCKVINFGDRIAQIIPERRQDANMEMISNEEFDELCKIRGDSRGVGGFGHSGK